MSLHFRGMANYSFSSAIMRTQNINSAALGILEGTKVGQKPEKQSQAIENSWVL